MFVTPTIIILQQFVIVMTLVTAIIMGISTVAMIIPQAAYATEDKGNPSSSEDEDCSSDELPASIDGTIRCMEHYSYEFEGKEVKHCNFMTSSSDE
ncbi:MAG TPA: hypothetical protein VKA87_09640 [Nitrososphaeraceae archaeon]|nr:hypothetical protein [Nitrososphaeraceae archaeon]